MAGVNSLLQWLNGHRELLKAVPIASCTVLHFGDALVDRFDDIPCTFHYHVGDLRVAAEGHNIASYGLDKVLDRLGGSVSVTPEIGETKELFRWGVAS
jgi:hypothetical protein